MDISYLADCPQFVPTLARWFHAQWGFFVAGSTVETFTERLRAHLNRDSLPLAFVAHDGPALLGSASLRPHDMESRLDLTPWLGGVYVEESKRCHGIGAALAQAVEQKARTLAFPVLYLFTFDKEGYYQKLGWELVERTEYRGHSVVVMRKELGASLRHDH